MEHVGKNGVLTQSAAQDSDRKQAEYHNTWKRVLILYFK